MQSHGCKSPPAKPWEMSVHTTVVSGGGRCTSGFSLLLLHGLGRFKLALLYSHMPASTLPLFSVDMARSRKPAPEPILGIISWLHPGRDKMAINCSGARSVLPEQRNPLEKHEVVKKTGGELWMPILT